MFTTRTPTHRRRISSAHLIALLALFVSLGGASYAAIKIPANSIASKQVRDRSLKAKDFAKGQLPKGPKGARGATGAIGPRGGAGPAGPRGATGTKGADGIAYSGFVEGTTGQLHAGRNLTAKRLEEAHYCLTPTDGADPQKANPVVTPYSSFAGQRTAEVLSFQPAECPHGWEVVTRFDTGRGLLPGDVSFAILAPRA